MPFVLLLLFALVCLQTQWPAPPSWLTPGGCAVLTWANVALFWVLAGLLAQMGAAQLTRDPWQRGRLLRRIARWRTWHLAALVLSSLGALYYLGWGSLVKGPQQIIPNVPGLELLLLAPFLVGLVLSWERFYLLEKTVCEQSHPPDPFIPKWDFLTLQARHNLLLVVPPTCLWLLHQIVAYFMPGLADNQALLPLFGIAMLTLALIGVPFLLRVFLGLRPLPAGPLRQRLEGTSARLGFRCSDILVWDTRQTMANAMISGFLPWARYIVLTDRLITELTPEEVEAVFGHEVGHVKHHHLLTYVLFCLLSLFTLAGVIEVGGALFGVEPSETLAPTMAADGTSLWGLMPEWLPQTSEVETGLIVAQLLALGLYMFVVFGLLSRRCERQADLFGCRAVSSEVFISALERVASLNGMPRDRAGNWLVSWQHPTIAQRVEFIRAVSGDAAREARFHRSLGLLKWGMVASLLLVVALLLAVLGPDKVWGLFRLI